jgi:hypothetical protein
MSENNEPKSNLLPFVNKYWTDSNGVNRRYQLDPEWILDAHFSAKEKMGCWLVLLALAAFWWAAYKLFMWWLS